MSRAAPTGVYWRGARGGWMEKLRLHPRGEAPVKALDTGLHGDKLAALGGHSLPLSYSHI